MAMAGLLAGVRPATRTVTVALDESAPVDRRRLAALLDPGHQVVPLTCALAGAVAPDVLVTWPAATVTAEQLTTIWPTATVVPLTALPRRPGDRLAATGPTGPDWRPDLRGLADRIAQLPDRETGAGAATATGTAGAAGAAGWWADGGVVRVRLVTHRLWPAGTVLDDADLVIWGGPHPAAVGCALTATGYGHHGEPVRLRLSASAGRLDGGRVSLHGWATTGDDRVHLLLEGRLRLSAAHRTGSDHPAGQADQADQAGPVTDAGTRSVDLVLTGRAPDAQPDRRFRLHVRARQATRGPVPAVLAARAS